jgi:hypothetical protein
MNVVGLEIAVDDSFFVGGGKSSRNVKGVLNQPTARKGSSHQGLTERLAFEEFGNEEADVVLFTDVIDGEDVGMVQRAQDLRLVLKTMKPVGISRESGGKNLQGNSAVKASIPSAIDLAHPTSA